MKTLAAITLVLIGVTTILGSKDQHWVDYRLVSSQTFSFQNGSQPHARAEPTCTATGKVCDDDCKKIWVCSNNNGVLGPKLVGTCTGIQTCNNGDCSSTPTPECSPAAQKRFVCPAEGVYPDPTTCKKYHYCIQDSGELINYVRSCPMHYGYNSGTTYCSKNLTNNHCGADYPVPICTSPAQNGALKDNKSMYYVCALYENTGNILYPYLRLCANGKEYDGNYGCK